MGALFDEGARKHNLSFLPWASFQGVFFRSQLIARHYGALNLSTGPVTPLDFTAAGGEAAESR
jgi:hypothetical protein